MAKRKSFEVKRAKARKLLRKLRSVHCDNFEVVGVSTWRALKIRLAFPKPHKKRGRGCRIGLRDDAEKQRRGYTDPRSFVRLDGSEVLHGVDWLKRKQELGERSGGRCEYKDEAGFRCVWQAQDAHHIVNRSKKRDDRLSNLEHLCRMHHEQRDKRRPRWTPKHP